MVAAEHCPECQRPRPRGALRCACNYTFEYASERGGGFGGLSSRGRRASGTLDGALFALALFAAIAGYALVPREPEHAAVGALLVGAGVFAAIAAIGNIGWFFAARRARLITLVLGRAGARVVYVLIGGGLVGAGAQLLLAT